MKLVSKLVVADDGNTFDIIGLDGSPLVCGVKEVKFEKVSTPIPGDANSNGIVDVDDIKDISDMVMKWPSSTVDLFSADANGDEDVNAADIVTVVSIIQDGQLQQKNSDKGYAGGKLLICYKDGVIKNMASSKEILFARDGDAENYVWYTLESKQTDYSSLKNDFDISNVKSITSISESDNSFTVALPENVSINQSEIAVLAYNEQIMPSSDNSYKTSASAVSVVDKEGRVIYDCYASLDEQDAQRHIELNAMETAYSLLLPIFPHVFEPTSDEIFASLKSLLADLPETHALAAAIDASILKNGYLMMDDVETEYQTAVDRIIEKLGLRDNYLKESSGTRALSPRSPYIVNGDGVYGYKLVMNSSRWVENDLAKAWICNLTAYNSNRFAYTAWVRGYKDSDGQAYLYSDDYDLLRKSILKPQRVSTFMGTFTDPLTSPFKKDSWEGLANYFSDSYKLFFEKDFGFADMTWDNTKATFDMTFLTSNDVVIVIGPADNELMLLYNVLKSILDPAIKYIAKNLTNAKDDDFMLNFCISLLSDYDYRADFSDIIHSNKVYSLKAKEIFELTWPKMREYLGNAFLNDLKTLGEQYVWDHYGWIAAIDVEKAFKKITENWNKWLKIVEKAGDVSLGILGLTEGSFYYDLSLDFGKDKTLALESNKITITTGSEKLVKIISGNGTYTLDNDPSEVAIASLKGIAGTNEGTVYAVMITAKKAGTCYITVTDTWTRLTSVIEVNVPQSEAVDLGLPSGTLWSRVNVGADSPEDFGGYYAWAEVQEKNTYSWSNYKYSDATGNHISKYCKSSYYGTVDGRYVIEPMDDAARVNMGSNWRIPTEEEMDELVNKCKWEIESLNNVQGYRVTGPNGNSIFFPFGGHKSGNNIYNCGGTGFYWVSTLSDSQYTSAIYMYNNKRDYMDYARYFGNSIRPVLNKSTNTSWR